MIDNIELIEKLPIIPNSNSSDQIPNTSLLIDPTAKERDRTSTNPSLRITGRRLSQPYYKDQI